MVLTGAQAAFAKNQYAGFIAALSYSVFSITITLFNKTLLTTYGFDSTLTLTFLQGCVTVSCLEYMKWKGWINYPKFNLKTAIVVLPLSLSFMSYVVVSLMALGRVNVPMFTALRRLGILFTVVQEYLYFGEERREDCAPEVPDAVSTVVVLAPPPLVPLYCPPSLRFFLVNRAQARYRRGPSSKASHL